ncbi:hypothetical protein L1N85_00485 [Paenibacillus alkaliterrae]|uniref:hypothetical protein n=1 Tax=Paenibacillus alkaliterrae TaxID=320909 RepID=UPI001F16E45B|nr:hypothetical protein [Paenibacillus alkaliterrae]MCF2936904.1 hypothetical protein [Paenibacillus alkaliterrae]
MDPILFFIICLVVFLLLLSIVIRGAINSSKLTKQLEELTNEVQWLRIEIKENKHIADKRV